MSDKVIVITGASDGIGAAAARLLKAQDENVVVVGRSPQKTEAVAKAIDARYYLADFTKFDDVRKLAVQLKKDFPRIDVLVNNAGGVMGRERKLTVDGNEMTIQVNHLAPFLLTNLLLNTLISSKATVIATSSLAYKWAKKLDLNDITINNGYSRMSAYGKGKLMNILFTKELNKRYHTQGIAAVAFHPGVVRTNFASEFGGSMRLLYTSPLKYLLISPEKGADTMVWLATSDAGKDWQPGEYYSKRKIMMPNVQAQDAKLASDLWELSKKLTATR